MIRMVPHGVKIGQVISPLVASEMTNGKIAPAKVRYEVRVVYPGGVIVMNAARAGQPATPDEDAEAPSGLIKAGTPVHVEGEEAPTDEELARYVNAGLLGTNELSERGQKTADAADFVGTGVWDYRIDPSKAVKTPRQASVVCQILVESGKTEFLESEAVKLMRDQGPRFNSKQDPAQIFRYYRSNLATAGFLIQRTQSHKS